MQITSTNIGKSKTVVWQGKEVQTGIFKTPVDAPLILESTDVKGDAVIDRRYHGGIDKACYLFSADHYAYWKAKYPDLDWTYGMFGENLTVKNANEKAIYIGDTYRIGTAVVQVAQPRQPCFKLGIRFNTQQVIKDFIQQPYSGIYVRVLQSGQVKVGDTFQLTDRVEPGVSVADVFQAFYQRSCDPVVLQRILDHPALPQNCKDSIQTKHSS